MKLFSFPKLIRKGTPHTPTLALILTVAASVAALALALPTSFGHAQGNDTDLGSRSNCQAYDSNLDGNIDAEVCIQNLSADPTEIVPDGSTEISWNINYYQADGKPEVVCNLTGDPFLSTINDSDGKLWGPEESPVSLDRSRFRADTTTVTVACEIAPDSKDSEQPSTDDDYGNFEQQVDVTKGSGDSNNPPKADPDGTTTAGVCLENTDDPLVQKIDVLDNDGDDNGNNYDKSNIIITQITEEPSTTGSDAVQIISDNGVDKLSYIPDPNTTGEVTFEYEAEFPDPESTTDTATVTADVGSCGNIEVSFSGGPGGTADPTYTYDGISPLPSRTADSAGDQLTWSVPLEVATNTAELIDDYIDPPEGYQLDTFAAGDANIQKDTETGRNFTKSQTSAWLGEDYTPETPDVSDDGTTESYTGYGYQSCHFCHTGDAYTYIESFEADVTKTTKPDGSVVFSYKNEEYTGYDAVSGNSSACTQEIAADTLTCYERWEDAKGNKDPTWNPPGSYCPESGTESSCYPETDWPESSDEGSGSSGDTSQTCDSYTVYEPYPNCPPGTEATEYGYATCEKRCVRTASP